MRSRSISSEGENSGGVTQEKHQLQDTSRRSLYLFLDCSPCIVYLLVWLISQQETCFVTYFGWFYALLGTCYGVSIPYFRNLFLVN